MYPLLLTPPQLLLQRNLVRLARSTAGWGFQVGAFAAVFLGVQASLAARRGAGGPQWSDTAAAGSLTAGCGGALLPRGLPARARGTALGLAVGAALGAPLGLLQQLAEEELRKEGGVGAEQKAPAPPHRPTPSGAAEAAVRVLTS